MNEHIVFTFQDVHSDQTSVLWSTRIHLSTCGLEAIWSHPALPPMILSSSCITASLTSSGRCGDKAGRTDLHAKRWVLMFSELPINAEFYPLNYNSLFKSPAEIGVFRFLPFSLLRHLYWVGPTRKRRFFLILYHNHPLSSHLSPCVQLISPSLQFIPSCTFLCDLLARHNHFPKTFTVVILSFLQRCVFFIKKMSVFFPQKELCPIIRPWMLVRTYFEIFFRETIQFRHIHQTSAPVQTPNTSATHRCDHGTSRIVMVSVGCQFSREWLVIGGWKNNELRRTKSWMSRELKRKSNFALQKVVLEIKGWNCCHVPLL